MRQAFAGAGNTASVQHSRFPLAYPEETGRHLLNSFSLPTIPPTFHDLHSRLLAPTVIAPARAFSPKRRTGTWVTSSQRDRTVRGIRDRLETSGLSDALKKDCIRRMNCVTERENEKRAVRLEACRWDSDHEEAVGEERRLDDESVVESSALELTDKYQLGDARGVESGVAEPAMIVQSASAPALPSFSSVGHKQEKHVVQPLWLRSSDLEIAGVANMAAPLTRDSSWPQHQIIAETRLLPVSKRPAFPTDHTVTGGWRRTDVQRTATTTPMRSTWSGPGSSSGPSTSRKASKMVDWNVAWLEHPEARGLTPLPQTGLAPQPRSRSRSPSPQGERSPRTLPMVNADMSRNYNVLSPPMNVYSPMLLTGSEHKKIGRRPMALPPHSLEVRTSSSEWRVKKLFESSLCHAVRG